MTSVLPSNENVGKSGTWLLPTEDGSVAVEGKFLGMSSSHRSGHNRNTAHYRGYPRKGTPCSACRWSVFRVFRNADGYTIHHTGMSAVPGETMRFRNELVGTAYEVVESMTTRRDRQAFLTVAAARVLAQCAAYDVPLRDAYENRAVG